MWPKFSTVLFDHYIPSNNPEDYLASSQIQETFNIEETLKVDIQSKVWRYADKVYKHIFNKTLSELEVWTAKWNYFFQNSYDGVISELATARVVTINRIHAIETPYIKDEFSLLENNTKMNKTFFDNAHKLRMTMLDSHVRQYTTL